MRDLTSSAAFVAAAAVTEDCDPFEATEGRAPESDSGDDLFGVIFHRCHTGAAYTLEDSVNQGMQAILAGPADEDAEVQLHSEIYELLRRTMPHIYFSPCITCSDAMLHSDAHCRQDELCAMVAVDDSVSCPD